MKRELDYFCIEGRFGGRQSWFWDPIMRMAGCAAIAASDSCISLANTFGLKRLCPYAPEQLTKRTYMRFAQHMKKGYLFPKFKGISRLELYIEGMRHYLDCLLYTSGGPAQMARHRRVLPGRAVCPLCHLPYRCLFPGGQYVRLPLVPRNPCLLYTSGFCDICLMAVSKLQ